MAISQAERRAINNSIYGYIGQGTLDEREILRRIGDKYDVDNDDFLTVLNAIRRAKRSGDLGESLNDDLTSTTSGTAVPLDYSLYGSNGLYGYRVRVNFFEQVGGNRWDTVVLISSDRPLNGSEILSEAQDAAQGISSSGTTTNPRDPASQSVVVSFEIISAGRRP